MLHSMFGQDGFEPLGRKFGDVPKYKGKEFSECLEKTFSTSVTLTRWTLHTLDLQDQ